MKISIHSRETIEKLIEKDFLENTAVISFYDPSGPYSQKAVDYKERARRVFQIAIYDIDIEVLEKYNLTFDTYFTEVEELAEFIYDAYAEDMNIICQCEYGQSRSAGCAAAILEHFESNGISIFRDYRYYPNQLIFNKMLDALEAEKIKRLSEK